MTEFQIEITPTSNLHIPADVAQEHFRDDRCAILRTSPSKLLVMPMTRYAAGSLIMKQRNTAGDRAVLAKDALGDDHRSGTFPARWEDRRIVIDLPELDISDSPVVRPQPLGVFPLPAGLMLITGEDSEPVRESLLAGKLPTTWPRSLAAIEAVFKDDGEEAIRHLQRQNDPIARFNLMVLAPEMADVDLVRAELEPFGLAPLVDFTLIAHGMSQDYPADPAGTCTDEVAAMVYTARATLAGLGTGGSEDEAIAQLQLAASAARSVSPVLSALIMADIAARTGDEEAAQFAVQTLEGTDLHEPLAEALLTRGMIAHQGSGGNPGAINAAIKDYQKALEHVSEESNPYLYGRTHLNLGTAYLGLPMTQASDKLRHGIAVQSLRTAVRLLDPEQHMVQWSAAQLNLANSLVYSPSVHSRDNLMEAVDIYEVVRRTRDEFDPMGLARVLANQGTALSHLGLVDDARARLTEAKALFESVGNTDAAELVAESLDRLEGTTDV